MNTFATIKHINTFKLVSFYSLCLNEESVSIFEKFQKEYSKDPDVKDDLKIIMGWIRKMGNHKGAKSHYFRHEGRADGLPPPSRFLGGDVGRLRLYCYRVTDELVFLFDGGIKTKDKAQHCPNVSIKFRAADKYVKVIDQAFAYNDLQIDTEFLHRLIVEDKFELMI